MAAKITITGNLTREPEMKTLGGQSAATFSVAVRTRAKNSDGSYKSNFYDCTFFGKMGEYFMARAQKGTGVVVIGDLTADAYVGTNGNSNEARPTLRINVDSAECMARLKETGAATVQPTAPAASDDVIPF